MSSYTVIYNPHAGHNRAQPVAQRLQHRLTQAGHTVQLQPTKGPDDAPDLAFSALSDVVVAMGGDGTISQVVAGLMNRRDPPLLGIVPQGTVNNLAKVLKIPLIAELAFRNLTTGTPQPIDIGMVNGETMISTMTLGVMANAALAVTQRDKQRFGPIVYLAKGAKVLAQHQHWQMTLDSPHHHWQRDTQVVLVTMTNSVGGFTNFVPEAAPDDGKFHVFVAPKLTLWRSLLALPYFITGNFTKFPGMTYFTTDHLHIEAKTKRPLQSRIDGDPSTALPLDMHVVSDKIRVITPASR